VKDYTGAVSFESVGIGDLKKREKQLNDEFIEAVKAWRAAKKEGGTTAGETPPRKPNLLVLGKVRGKAQAENATALVKDRWEAKQRKAETKDSAETPKEDTKAKE
jgi:hypothetical protein